MFNFFRTLFFLGALKRIKSRLFIIISSLILIAFFNAFFDDISSIPNDSPYFLLAIKWIFILALIAVIALQVKKIISTNYLSIKKDKALDDCNDNEALSKKHKLLKKEKLTSRADIIVKKYKN